MNATEIVPNLFMGGELLPAMPTEFDAVMCLRWEANDLAMPLHHMQRLKIYAWVPMVDGPVLPDKMVLAKSVDLVRGWLSVGWKTLVHCGEGKNRSGLVVARVMRGMYYEPQEIIDLIRSKRPGALNNQTFVDYILSRP